MTDVKKRNFWDDRAELGENAGTNDFLLKELEMKLLCERVPEGACVLDAGCGNGKTLIALALSTGCSGVGIDFSEKMVTSAAKRSREEGIDSVLSFRTSTLEDLQVEPEGFDCAISERSLINLADHEAQHRAFLSIMQAVKPGGLYLMIESSEQGLERTNALRASLELEAIDRPWHNVFVDEEKVQNWETDCYVLEEMYPFSSSYYLLSRVVYAKLAADAGEELRYDSDINILSMKLPPIGNFGPTRLWQWRKK